MGKRGGEREPKTPRVAGNRNAQQSLFCAKLTLPRERGPITAANRLRITKKSLFKRGERSNSGDFPEGQNKTRTLLNGEKDSEQERVLAFMEERRKGRE